MVSNNLYFIEYFIMILIYIRTIIGIRDDGVCENNEGNNSGECSGALNNDMKELSIDGMEWVVKCLKAFFMLWFVLALMNCIFIMIHLTNLRLFLYTFDRDIIREEEV